MAQRLDTSRVDTRVRVSCLVSDLEFTWTLTPIGEETDIAVDVVLPEAEAHRLETQRAVIARSLVNLVDLAAGRRQ